jgi:hypothetical protein
VIFCIVSAIAASGVCIEGAELVTTASECSVRGERHRYEVTAEKLRLMLVALPPPLRH